MLVYTKVVLPADADAEIVGVGISEEVGVSGRLLLDKPSKPRSSHPRRNWFSRFVWRVWRPPVSTSRSRRCPGISRVSNWVQRILMTVATRSRSGQLRLNVSFQVFIFFLADDTVEDDEEDADTHRKQSRQHQLIPPAVFRENAPRILSWGIVWDKACAKQKHSKHHEDNAYVEHSYTRHPLKLRSKSF